jgi:hypothetical protein
MWAAIAFGVTAVVGLVVVLARTRHSKASLVDQPWMLQEIPRLHVPIMAGLAGFAITGLVLIATLTRGGRTSSAAFDTVVVMFLIAYLFYIGTAFLISYLPHPERSGELVPRIHFSLATTIEYRSVFISWFALRPLMDVYGLDRPADVLAVLLPVSLVLGSTLVAMVTDGLGLIRIVETYFCAGVAAVLALGYAAVVEWAVPGARTSDSALAIALVVFALNSVGYALAASTPLAARYPQVARFYERHGRTVIVADTLLTMLALTFLWLAVVGAI